MSSTIEYSVVCQSGEGWVEVGRVVDAPTLPKAVELVEEWLAADPVNKSLQWRIDKVETRTTPVREWPGPAALEGRRHYFRFGHGHICSVAGCMASRENAIHIIDGSPAYYAALRDTPVLDALSE